MLLRRLYFNVSCYSLLQYLIMFVRLLVSYTYTMWLRNVFYVAFFYWLWPSPGKDVCAFISYRVGRFVVWSSFKCCLSRTTIHIILHVISATWRNPGCWVGHAIIGDASFSTRSTAVWGVVRQARTRDYMTHARAAIYALTLALRTSTRLTKPPSLFFVRHLLLREDIYTCTW